MRSAFGSLFGSTAGLVAGSAIRYRAARACWLFACAVCVAGVGPARAADGLSAIPNVTFSPTAPHAMTYSPTHGEELALTVDLGAEFMTGLVNAPVTNAPLLDDTVMGRLGVQFEFLRHFALRVQLPAALYQSGPLLTSPEAGFYLGDTVVAASGSYEFREVRGLSIGMYGQLDIPSGDDARYLSDGKFGGTVITGIAYQVSIFQLTANVGLRVRTEETFKSTTIGLSGLYRAGVAVAPIEPLNIGVELVGETRGSRAGGSPLEVLVKINGNVYEGLFLSAAAGAGLTSGFGAPAWRAMGGVGYRFDLSHVRLPERKAARAREKAREADPDFEDLVPELEDDEEDDEDEPTPVAEKPATSATQSRVRKLPPIKTPVITIDEEPVDESLLLELRDSDFDMLSDKDDRCRNAPEDADGYQDFDGCPEPDNDGDLVPDQRDLCPLFFGDTMRLNGCPLTLLSETVSPDGSRLRLRLPAVAGDATRKPLPAKVMTKSIARITPEGHVGEVYGWIDPAFVEAGVLEEVARVYVAGSGRLAVDVRAFKYDYAAKTWVPTESKSMSRVVQRLRELGVGASAIIVHGADDGPAAIAPPPSRMPRTGKAIFLRVAHPVEVRTTPSR